MTMHPHLQTGIPADSAARLLARAARRISEGPHLWGAIDVTPTGRTSYCRTRLTVYPPGTNAAERRALRFYRNWPVAGAVLALFLFLALAEMPALVVTSIAISVYAAGIWAGHAATRSLRPHVRRLTVLTAATGQHFETLGDIAFFQAATDQLRAMDKLNDHGLLSAAEYESYWAEIYDALPAA
ncbi:DUF6611 family protein [Subtercola endophyticus]|uniref:DUF6611 family protein n=1 Tax=Subtercola endophyticus TaxID=2895559 RepID=UPI001E41B107|nr:DUF6611 family protein [Subtercola endophyticus]UFS59120.1 hypothetical protein LQ955_19450 [Subtercola endophyticus]